MTAVSSPLADALRDRYVLERELGRGGMATVYLAHDRKHDRKVALKVLYPELAATLGPDRFQREIRTTARLQHPHILPVLDSGEAAGQLWYAMPFVRGESLRERLRRETQLPVDVAVELARQIALALDYAHREGVVHRDLKPENVLLSEGQALVADFGVAKALGATSEGQLTGTGVVVGTPTYMSPEQAIGGLVDARSDIYALGCVLYETLAGEPPYTGATAQAVTAKRLTDPIPSVRRLREEVPDTVDRAIRRALAKTPADRFVTADQFGSAIVAPRERDGAAVRPRAKRYRGLRWAALALVPVALLGLGLRLLSPRQPDAAATDERAVMILPFRVAGAAPDLAYLREGMVDLLSAKLTGDGGARSVDARTALSAWRQAGGSEQDDVPEQTARVVARRVGAARLLEGSIVGAPSRLIVNASLTSVSGGRGPASVTMEGPLDSLSVLVDRLTGLLLAGEAGEDEKLSNLTTTSLPALRAYLEGRSAYRNGRYQDAVQQFRRALEFDSTFALAAIGLRSAAVWTAFHEQASRGLALAWAARERLSKRDRLFLIAAAGPRYPAPSSYSEQLSAWERVLEVAPDQPESQYELADVLFHFGRVFEAEDSWDRARRAFARALALDSTFSSPLSHLIDIAAVDHDSAQVRALSELYLSRNPRADNADYVRWRLANALGDSAGLSIVRARFGTMPWEVLSNIAQIGQYDGISLDDISHVMELVLSKTEKPENRQFVLVGVAFVALNQGRPLAAAEVVKRMHTYDTPDHPHDAHYLAVLNALYWNGDTVSAVAAVSRLARSGETLSIPDSVARATQLFDLCIRELWSMGRHSQERVERAITLLNAGSGNTESEYRERLCAALLDAKRTAHDAREKSEGKLIYLDSLARARGDGPWVGSTLALAANLELARLREAQGDIDGAIRAVQRRTYFGWDLDLFSTALQEEGRLAAAAGRRADAVRAYQHYLALRSDPEPSQASEVQQVRGELGKLLAESPQ